MRFPLRLALLGSVTLEDADGRPVNLPLGKPLGLLAHVACVRAPVPRRVAAELFWPAARRPDHSLRQALTTLRTSVSGRLFMGRGPLVLTAEVVRLDVEELSGISTAEDMPRLLALLRGQAFGGLALDHTPALSGWRTEHVRRIGHDVASAVRRVATDLVGHGRRDEAGRLVDAIAACGLEGIEVRDAVFGSERVLMVAGEVREVGIRPSPGGPLRSARAGVHADAGALGRLFGSRRLTGSSGSQGGSS